jgi:hypothetical protein
MAEVPLSLGSWTIPVPQLSVSNSNSSQGLNHSSPLTNLLTYQPTPFQCTALHYTTLTEMIWTESESYITTDGQRPVCLGIKHPSGAHGQICITVRQLQVCWCGALSLTRGWSVIYNCCWPLTLQSFSGLDHILLSRIRDFPFCHLLLLAQPSPASTQGSDLNWTELNLVNHAI